MSSKETHAKEERTQLGARLREAREYLALSQDEVAQALNIPRSAISLIETGRRRVDALEIKKLAHLYQRSVDYFTNGEKERPTLPTAVRHLARTASSLSERDHEELLRFAEFLKSKSNDRKA